MAMRQKEYKALYDYLAKNCDEVAAFFEKDRSGAITGKFKKTAGCKLHLIEEIFDTKIQCSQYDVVANGEGNEEEKIDTIYSSSLQSLLVFHNVKENNEITIGGERFNRVVFEYKNKVIGYPSSVDVVLMNDHAIAFIESKFLEIVRDSNTKGNKVVGISYFGEKENGYSKIGLTEKELNVIRIEHDYPREKIAKDHSPYLENISGYSKFKQKITKIDGAKFVYSEGIKQILSHIIGIKSFKEGESAYPNADPISNHKSFAKVMYVELYNEFPDLDFAGKKIEDFERHVEVVKEIVNDKKIVDKFIIMSYQDLFKNNKGYNFDSRVVNYFGLNKKKQ